MRLKFSDRLTCVAATTDLFLLIVHIKAKLIQWPTEKKEVENGSVSAHRCKKNE